MRWEPKRKWNCRKKGQQKSPFLSVPSQPSDIQEVPSIYEVPTRHHPCLPLYPLRARFYLTLDHFPFSLIAWSPYAQYPELSSGKVEECSPILENVRQMLMLSNRKDITRRDSGFHASVGMQKPLIYLAPCRFRCCLAKWV